jgi:hypothetical protein
MPVATKPSRKPQSKPLKGKVSARVPRKGTSMVNAPHSNYSSDRIKAVIEDGINRNVAPRGYAADGKELENIEKFSWPCPREHFIHGPADLTPHAIAAIWGLDQKTVYRWAKEDNWHELRDAQLGKRTISQGGTLVTDKALAMRDEQVELELADYDLILEHCRERLVAVTEEMNTAVGIKEVKKTDASFAKVADVILKTHEKRRIAVGLNVKAAGAFDGATVNVNEIKQTVINAPLGAPIMAPLPAPTSEIVESEVVDG